jgi:SRSO17 transposase
MRCHTPPLGIGHLGDPQAVLIVDETGDLRKGRHTGRRATAYSGNTKKIENC